MNQRINNITGLSFVAIRDIETFQTSGAGSSGLPTSVAIESAAWTALPFVIGSCELDINETTEDAGKVFESVLNFRTKEWQPDTLPSIVKIDFEDDDSLILGDPDLPVRLNQGKALFRKSINTTHRSWHEPLILLP